MKKILTILAIIMVAFSGTVSAEEWTEVSTAQEFYNTIKGNAYANVKLTADIDLSDLKPGDWEIFNEFTFKGKLTGEKSDGSNYTITSNGQTNGSILFEKVEGATISHITFKNFKSNNSTGEKIAVVARESSYGTYECLTLKDCSIIKANKEIGGFVAISKNETFTHCTTSSDCYFEGITTAGDTNIGGIAGKAYNCTFTLCHNAAELKQENNQQGGIVAYSSGCTIDRCLNTGKLTGVANAGGIVGNAASATVITRCVNTGTLNYGDGSAKKRGGIAGLLQDKGSCVKQCLNFGEIVGAGNDYGEIVGGREDGATEWRDASMHCFYYCQYNGKHADNESMYSDDSIYRWAKVQSGEFAFKSTIDEAGSERWLYQDIDAWIGSEENPFASKYPVPVPEAGEIYSNILCDGTQSYSNVYQSTGAHTYTPGKFGFCTVCGNQKWNDNGIHISTSEDFKKILYLFNNGIDFKNNIRLDNDIDISGMPASTDGYLFGREFKGVLDGQGHALRNSTHPLFYRMYKAYVMGLVLDRFYVSDATSLIARTSGSSTFVDVTVKNSWLQPNDAGTNIGMIVGYSDNDYITYCKTDSTCAVYSIHDYTGGIAGYLCNGGIVEKCHNAATVKSLDTNVENVGGIVGKVYDAYIHNCLNTGLVKGGKNETGGIAGYVISYAKCSELTYCVNTGTIQTVLDSHDYVGGILGACKADNLIYVNNCINFGFIDYNVDSDDRTVHEICGYNESPDFYISEKLYYHCKFGEEGGMRSNLKSMGTSIEEVRSGKFAFDNGWWLYQDIDNNTFETRYPVPIPEAGDVYSNILCDGTQSYSNNYDSKGAHATQLALSGKCSVCGKSYPLTDDVHVATAELLNEIAGYINNGADYSNCTVYLDNDIDYKPSEDSGKALAFTPIGSQTHPYKGTFDGQGHSIKNMVVNTYNNAGGLFGYVAGKNTVIRNMIIDASCTVYSNAGSGIAGVVGGVSNPSDSVCNVTIMNCGNEAYFVDGQDKVGGILGGVCAGEDNTTITIANCYNKGEVKGTSNLASLCGYAGKNYTITNCYNIAEASYRGAKYLYNSAETATGTVTNCYDINEPQEGVVLTTEDKVLYGELCFNLNSNGSTVFTQDLATDTYPVPGIEGLHYTRTMDNQWGTLCLPFDIYLGTADCDFYKLSSVTDDVLTLTKMEKVGCLSAGTPVIIKRSESDSGINVYPDDYAQFLLFPGSGSSASGITLTGTYTTKDISSETGYFIKDNAFWNIQQLREEDGRSIVVDPFRAYLAGSLASNARQLTLSDEITGIEEVLNGLNGLNGFEGEIYDLGGRQIQELQKGVNIIKLKNGTTKKIIIR